ncbi:MAG: P-protein, partial [Spirochaetia bacterium]|nr:P-protein [Spirochaetia bacterium]
VYEQCRNWLSSNLFIPEVEFVETSSTAAAAQIASEKKDGVAIGSELAAETYGLKIIASNIQDSMNNITRFFVMGKEQCPPTGDDKTSIVCSVSDRPGSLYEMLIPFHNSRINLTRIESVATRRSYGDYNFFIDFLGHANDEKISKILNELKARTAMLKILGSYPRADLP